VISGETVLGKIDAVLEAIVRALPPPKGDACDASLNALSGRSWVRRLSRRRGAGARIVDGVMKKGPAHPMMGVTMAA